MTEITRVGGLNAARAGGDAFRAGHGRQACPHTGSDLGDEFLAHYWMRGWRAAEDEAKRRRSCR